MLRYEFVERQCPLLVSRRLSNATCMRNSTFSVLVSIHRLPT